MPSQRPIGTSTGRPPAGKAAGRAVRGFASTQATMLVDGGSGEPYSGGDGLDDSRGASVIRKNR